MFAAHLLIIIIIMKSMITMMTMMKLMMLVLKMMMMPITCMIQFRMMVGPSKVYGEHVAGYPVVEEPQQQRLPGVPVDDDEDSVGFFYDK